MKRPAITLIEVVAALALLATVVTTVLVAQARSMRQIHATDERLRAAALAESLLTQWRLDEVALDTPDRGVCTEEGWSWSRQVERERISLGRAIGAQRPEMLRVRLAVRRDRERRPPEELAVLEWLTPVPRKMP